MSAQASALRQAGYQLMRAGRPGDAIKSLQQAAGVDPDAYETFAYLGAAYAQLQEFESARRAFGRAVQLDPNSAKARFNLGTAHQMAGDNDAARMCFEAALEIDPYYQQAKDAVAKLPPKVVTMSDLASSGTIHLPGAQATSLGDEEPVYPVSHMTPEEIARLCMPSGKMHLTGAQATDYGDSPAATPEHAWTPEEIARLSMPQGHLHMMGAQANEDQTDR